MTTPSSTKHTIVNTSSFSHGSGFIAHSIGQRQLGAVIQPFIQLDHYRMSQPTFPEHPHKGIAAVTYMFEDSEGSFFNHDSQGDRSFINPGDLHWTQAGTGIRHEETPTEPGKVCHGIQMFVDLEPADKVAPGKALHITAEHIPSYTTENGSRIRVVIGEVNGQKSPLETISPIQFLDITIPASGTIEHPIKPNETSFMLVIKGQGTVDHQPIHAEQGVLLSGDRIQIQANHEPLQFILCTRTTS
jgi:redox-sensitive bicupin YhaK (pirin superfamily)